MQYRTMPRSTDRLSILGLGLMRLPTDKAGKIDQDASMLMLDHAFASGVNYFDTAWPYHNGESEPLLGKWLEKATRENIFVATKLPCWLIKEPDDLARYFEQQLERMRTDYVDYYLLHSLGKRSWDAMKKFKALDFLDRMRSDGRIRHIGFSFHDKYPVFKSITLAYEWDFCQIMLNYLDTHYQAGINGYRLALEKQMGIISMEPLRGGKLVQQVPDEVKKLWGRSKQAWTPVQRALNWVWNLEGCIVALSGMSSMEQLQENIGLADLAQANILDTRELELYKKARLAYLRRIAIPCTECRYCLPCPYKVSIPACFGIYNDAKMFGTRDRHKREYQDWLPEETRADKCVSCGACLSKCPQHIDIPNRLKEVSEYFKA